MARGNTNTEATEATTKPSALTPPPATPAASWPTRSLRVGADNPFRQHVATALENSGTPYEVPAPDAKTARTWEGYLRGAAKDVDATINVYVREQEDGTATVFYRVTPGRTVRTRVQTYTAQDVRDWSASTEGQNFLASKGILPESVVPGKAIPKDVRNAYREAHGLTVK